MSQQIVLLAFVRAAVAGMAILATVLATRAFSQSDFGVISFVWSVATVCAFILDGGVAVSVRKYGLSRVVLGGSGGNIAKPFVFRFLAVVVLSLGTLWFVSFQPALVIGFVAILLALGFALEMLLADSFRHELKNIVADYLNGGLRNSLYLGFVGLAFVFSLHAIGLLFFVSGLLILVSVVVLAFQVSSVGGNQLATEQDDTSPETKVPGAGGERRRFFGVGFLMMASAHLPVLLAGAVAGAEEASLVRVALLFGTAMLFLNSALVLYFAPRMARASSDEVLKIQRKSAQLGRMVAFVGLVLIFALPFVVPIIFSADYSGAILGAQIIVGSVCFTSLFGAYNQMLLMTGYESLPFHSALIAPIITTLVPILFYEQSNIVHYCLGYASALVVGQLYTGVAGWIRFSLPPWGTR